MAMVHWYAIRLLCWAGRGEGDPQCATIYFCPPKAQMRDVTFHLVIDENMRLCLYMTKPLCLFCGQVSHLEPQICISQGHRMWQYLYLLNVSYPKETFFNVAIITSRSYIYCCSGLIFIYAVVP